MADLELCCMSMRRASLIELAEAASGAGYSYITATPRLFEDARLSDAALRRRIDDCAVRVRLIEGAGGLPPREPLSKPAQAGLDECIRVAHALGATCLSTVHSGDTTQPIDLIAEAYGKLCRRLASDGLRLLIEFLPGTGIPDLQTCLAVVGAVGERNGGILFDSWHFARSGGKLEQIDRAAVAWIGALQLSDRSPDQDLQPYVPMTGRKIPGQGALPLARMIAPILATHPKIPVGLEVLSEEMESMSFREAARVTACALRRVIDEAEVASGRDNPSTG